MKLTFISDNEKKLSEDFLENGFVIRDVEKKELLITLQNEVVTNVCEFLNLKKPKDNLLFLMEIQKVLPLEKLNNLRLKLYNDFNSKEWFRPSYYWMGKNIIDILVGNEICMQNKINFSIQMPDDSKSLLDIHADVFTGETPYQIVQWIPLVDVKNTGSMFILPLKKSIEYISSMSKIKDGGMKTVFSDVEKDLIWLDVPFGKQIIFTPNILHGNILNKEDFTRWSLNTRFTGLLTPFGTAEKNLGSYYSPIVTKVVTKIGLDYSHPKNFKE